MKDNAGKVFVINNFEAQNLTRINNYDYKVDLLYRTCYRGSELDSDK